MTLPLNSKVNTVNLFVLGRFHPCLSHGPTPLLPIPIRSPTPLLSPHEQTALVERLPAPPMRERMLHFSEGSVLGLKERVRQELLAARDAAGVSAVTRFQVLAFFMLRCFARAWHLAPDEEIVFGAASEGRGGRGDRRGARARRPRRRRGARAGAVGSQRDRR